MFPIEPSVTSQPFGFSIMNISIESTSVGTACTITVVLTGMSVKSSPSTGSPQTVTVLSIEPIPSSTERSTVINGYKAKPNNNAAIPRYMKTFHRDFFSASS